MPALVEVAEEHEVQRGWRFALRSIGPGGECYSHDLTLAWVDYDWWCPDGSQQPSRVALAVAEVMHHALSGGELPSRFDASTVRRSVPDADALIRRRLSVSGVG